MTGKMMPSVCPSLAVLLMYHITDINKNVLEI